MVLQDPIELTVLPQRTVAVRNMDAHVRWHPSPLWRYSGLSLRIPVIDWHSIALVNVDEFRFDYMSWNIWKFKLLRPTLSIHRQVYTKENELRLTIDIRYHVVCQGGNYWSVLIPLKRGKRRSLTTQVIRMELVWLKDGIKQERSISRWKFSSTRTCKGKSSFFLDRWLWLALLV